MKHQPKDKHGDPWDRIIQPVSSYLILGDVDTGKSGLAYWLLERFGKKYNLLPTVAGFPKEKAHLLPSECINLEDAIVLIDETDLQLPIEDTKARRYVVNFLSLPQHRNQIFLLAFHFPRLALGRYLPFFSGFLLKRPPYLIEFAGKRQGMAVNPLPSFWSFELRRAWAGVGLQDVPRGWSQPPWAQEVAGG